MSKRTGALIGAGLVVVLTLAIALVVVVGRATPAQAQTVSNQNGITVAGQGSYLVKPDIVRLDAGVNIRAVTVSEAQKQAAEKMKAVTDAVKAKGVKPEDIVTAYYNLQPEYDYNQGKTPTLNGYSVNTAISIVVRDIDKDIDKVGGVIDAAGTAGATQVNNIRFTVTNSADAQKQARQLAIADAKAKADQLAAASGVGIGGIISVTEVTNSTPFPAAQAGGRGAANADTGTPIEAGQFRIVIDVQVVYSLK